MRNKVLKPQSIVSLSQSVDIPDYIPPDEPIAEVPEIDLSDIEDEDVRKKYTSFIEQARNEGENIASGIIKNAEVQRDKIISEANEQAEKILKDAKVKSQNIMHNVMKEAEQIRTDAFNEGISKGVKEKSSAVDSVLSEFKSILEDMKSAQLDYFNRYAKELKYFTLDIVNKITMNKISEDDAFLEKLIVQNIKSIRDAEWITIEISERLPELVKKIEDEMTVCGMSKKTEIQLSDELDEDSCIMKATDRIVDISLRTQLDNIRAYFEKCDETDD